MLLLFSRNILLKSLRKELSAGSREMENENNKR